MHWQELVARPSTQFDCPTAAAAAVDDSRLGNSHASYTTHHQGSPDLHHVDLQLQKNTGRLVCHPSFKKTVRTVSARPFVPECPHGGAVCAKRVGAGKLVRCLHSVVGQTSQAARRARNMRFPPRARLGSPASPRPSFSGSHHGWTLGDPGHNDPERRSFASSNEKPQTRSNLGSDAPLGHCGARAAATHSHPFRALDGTGPRCESSVPLLVKADPLR